MSKRKLLRIERPNTDPGSSYTSRSLEVQAGDERRAVHIAVWLLREGSGATVAGMLLDDAQTAELRDALIAHTGWKP